MPSPPIPVELRDQLQATLGDAYTLERELPAGGMSRVFVAEERALGRTVVVKTLAPDYAGTVSVERFRREIRIVAQLQQANIVPVYAAGETNGLPYYTMPFVEGESLRAHLAKRGALPIGDALGILRDVARALEYAHAHNVVHRDIKPENVLLSGSTAVVTDFGIAKAVEASRTSEGTATLTQLGVALGTPMYMSPEQVMGEAMVDHRADLYAFGVLAYELLTGAPPFTAGTAQALYAAHIVQAPVPLAERRGDVPSDLANLVMRCLEKDPAERPAHARELLETIEQVGTKPRKSAPAVAHPFSIAVLPFSSLSPSPDDAYFADGLTDEIIADLTHVKSLRVTSRNSAMRYRDTEKATRAIGRELGVRYQLTGSIRRAGDALRVTAQLVDSDTDTQLWADRFAGEVSDVFAIQERIARSITAALQVHLSSEEDRGLAHRAIRDVRAYECFLEARHLSRQYSEEAFRRSVTLIDRAIAIEGDVPALIALKGAIVWSGYNLGITGREVLDEARRLIDRALAIDPDLGAALVARALIESKGDVVDSALLVRLLVRACERDGDVDGLMWACVFLAHVGRPDLSRQYAARAVALDPLTPLIIVVSAYPALFAVQTDDAVATVRRAATNDPDAVTRLFIGVMLASAGRIAEATAEWKRVMDEGGVWAELAGPLHAAVTGNRQAVVDGARAGEKYWHFDDQTAWMFAQALAAVGATDDAMRMLRHAAGRGFCNATFVAADHMLASLRDHPEMPQLLAYMRERSAAISLSAGLK